MHTTVANKIKGVWPRFSRLDPTGAFVPHVENKNCHLTIYFRLKKDFVPFFKNGTKLKLYLLRLLHLLTKLELPNEDQSDQWPQKWPMFSF